MRRRDITGVNQTCSTIDSIISATEDIMEYVEPGRILSTDDVEYIESTVKDIRDLCESVRDANSELREIAIDMSEKYKEQSDLCDDLTSQLSDTKDYAAYWRDQAEIQEVA